MQLNEVMDKLNEVMKRQDEYQNLYLNSKCKPSTNENISGIDNSQKQHLDEMTSLISNLKIAIDQLAKKVTQNEIQLDNLEQYSRSNCLILHGCQDIPHSSNNIEFENYVINTLNTRLQLPNPLNSMDIDICHILPSKKNKNPIIIKFVRRSVRNLVYASKSNLKSLRSDGPQLSITEALTKRRLRLVAEARKIFGFKNVWTMKGSVYCVHKNTKYQIRDLNDISKIKFPQ